MTDVVRLHPIAYWMLSAAAAVRASAGGLLRDPSGPVTWNIDRHADAIRR